MVGATGAPPLDHTHNTAATTDEERDFIEDSIVQQLEAPTDDDEDGDHNRSYDVDDVGLHPAAWPVLQYATYMTGTYKFVKEKHRAQGYLAAELARAEDEMAAEGHVGPVKRPTLEVNYRRVI